MTHPQHSVLKTSVHRLVWHGLAALGLLAGLTGPVQAQARFSYSSDGAEVADAKTGLVWQRCSAGQNWSGSTCAGAATAYTPEAALAYAQSQTGWRLPNVKELSSLVDRTVDYPSIDNLAFPASLDAVWAASPFTGNSTAVWAVNFVNGIVGVNQRNSTNKVRLVR